MSEPTPDLNAPENWTLEEALAAAVKLHRGGALEPAEEIYRRILEAAPDHPDALHFLGVLCHQHGRSDEGALLIQQALAIVPEHAGAWNNLGNVLQASGRRGEAISAYEKVAELAPENADARSNLGVALKSEGRLEEAEIAFREALGLDPHHPDAHHNLGNLLARRGATAEAEALFRKAVELKPDVGDNYHTLCNFLCHAGEHERARQVLDEWLAFQPENPIALHIQAALQGRTPERATADFIRSSYKKTAETFDDRLHLLEYSLPERIGEILAGSLGEPGGDLRVLDAGCGTGLAADGLRPFAKVLDGVDLSPEMLARAAAREVYDELAEADICLFLAERPEAYDLIVCLETLIYFGDLREVFTRFAGALAPGGHLFFTLEKAAPAGSGDGVLLASTGRYAHTESYVRSALTSAGLVVDSVGEECLRKEFGEPVSGFLVSASRPPA